MIVLVLLCTLIGWLVGYPLVGLAVGVLLGVCMLWAESGRRYF